MKYKGLHAPAGCGPGAMGALPQERKISMNCVQPVLFDHPLIQHKVSYLRDKNTGSKLFRELVAEIAMLMCYEATRDLELEEVEIETPITTARVGRVAGRKLAVVPVLRAGLGMLEGVLTLIPAAKVGHIGLYRDHDTCLPVEYFCKLPADISQRDVFILDPMLATGGSACDAVSLVKRRGARRIRFLCILAAPEGLEALGRAHPDVQVYCAALDQKLDENKYIVPGLGDAGDRIFGTK